MLRTLPAVFNISSRSLKISLCTLGPFRLCSISTQVHRNSRYKMASDAPLLIQLEAASVAVANKAGEIVRDIMKKGELGIIQKTHIKDLQTEADRKVQMCIATSLGRQFPGITIIGEEEMEKCNDENLVYNGKSDEVMACASKCPDQYKNVKPEQIVVWIDPLDGTQEYIEGLLDHVTVLIGIAVDGQSAAGVIHQPYFNYNVKGDDVKLGRTCWGIKGLGSYGFTHKPLPKDKTIITTTRSHPTPTVQEAIDSFKPDEVLRVGGCGHKVMIVLEGDAHVYLFASPGCKKWDTCGPQAILEAVGGRLTDIHGNILEYHKDVQKPNTAGVLATFENHDYYLKNIPQGIRDQLKVKL